MNLSKKKSTMYIPKKKSIYVPNKKLSLATIVVIAVIVLVTGAAW